MLNNSTFEFDTYESTCAHKKKKKKSKFPLPVIYLNFQSKLSDFEAAMMLQQSQQTQKTPFDVVGTYRYLAWSTRGMATGKVDGKMDIYSYGVVLL